MQYPFSRMEYKFVTSYIICSPNFGCTLAWPTTPIRAVFSLITRLILMIWIGKKKRNHNFGKHVFYGVKLIGDLQQNVVHLQDFLLGKW